MGSLLKKKQTLILMDSNMVDLKKKKNNKRKGSKRENVRTTIACSISFFSLSFPVFKSVLLY